ncbi:cation/H+ exchanger [Gymnopus androsaceus JB14]|uniref:Cation/H+ exchanger n=1 Tax=Gymnopus androsaceus JB14 TaxID=1447944 RepID=A0A6A4IDS0_9AGAR|nr:cation/H+ exchanger [Gymnopus androsaceus JB14]
MGIFHDLVFKRTAEAQDPSIFSGLNPSVYNMQDPVVLWIIQVIVIMAMVQALATIFGRMGQPRVIAEVIGGVFLGPTVMGRIPGFTNAIFPASSFPMLTLTSTIGLVLFLFIVGMEIDGRVMKKNVRASTAISVAGLAIPLGLGAALGVPIYREFTDPSVDYGTFLLFVAVAVGITAFPVLCRILTALKLLDTTVGVVTLAAGVGNDVVGWILLALTVALVNSSSGLTALYVLLTAVGYVLFLFFPVKWGYRWMAVKTGSLEEGTPSTLMMAVTLLIVFVSAFFTDIIGIHPIFGGFVAGLIIPKTNGYAIAVTEKIEDLVTILLLPIYFVLSGLKTNLGLLDTGKTWGYTFLIIAVAFVSKFVSCAATAKLSGFNVRESGAIGSLMSCKGLIELIVLNIGLEANILTTRTFSMFVIDAIILTFVTTPLVLLFYPAKYRRPAVTADDLSSKTIASSDESEELTNKFALVLDTIEQLPAAMTATQLLCPSVDSDSIEKDSAASLDEKSGLPAVPYGASAASDPFTSSVSLTLLRLINLSNRTSSVLKGQEAAALVHSDPVVSVFKTFAWLLGGGLKRLKLKVEVDVIPRDEFTDIVGQRVREDGAGMLVVPWASNMHAEESETHSVKNPFDGVFSSSVSTQDQMMTSVMYSEFIRKIFLTAPCDVSLFVDRGLSTPSVSGVGPDSLLVLPFFGGPDDRLALKVLVKICAGNAGVRAIALRITKNQADDNEDDLDKKHKIEALLHNTIAGADTVYANFNTETRLASDTADNITWHRYASSSSSDRSPSLSSALSRITFTTMQSLKPLHSVVEFFSGEDVRRTGRKHVVAIVGRSRKMAVEKLDGELQTLVSQRGSNVGSTVRKTLGDVGAALVVTGVEASLLVVQTCVSS